jgi:acetyl-CoA acyltransferase
MSDAGIIDAMRTPHVKERPGGALAGVLSVDLLAHPLAALVELTGIDRRVIDDVIAGRVSQIGEQSTNFARRAALAAGYSVLAGAYDVVVAAGVESMSHVPMGSAVAGADLDGTRLSERYLDALVPQGIPAELN